VITASLSLAVGAVTFRGYNPRMTLTREQMRAVVIELRLTGKHEGAYRGTPPSGRELAFRIIAHFQFDGEGRIARETAYYDRLTFMQQLGLGRR
jgi:steroid delta-isomerase-like uncharacterized protein